MRLSYVVPAVVFASQVAYASLVARQLEGLVSSVPEQCQSDCESLVSAVNTCPSDDAVAAATCYCGPILSGGLDTCTECLIKMVEDTAPSMATDMRAQLEQSLQSAKDGCASIDTPTDDSSPPSATAPRPSRSVDDSDDSSTPASRPSQSTIRGGSSPSESAEGSTNTANPLDQGSASSVKLGLSSVAAAAAGALLFL